MYSPPSAAIASISASSPGSQMKRTRARGVVSLIESSSGLTLWGRPRTGTRIATSFVVGAEKMRHYRPPSGMPSPLFTVVVTTYNRAQIACRCVDSCLDQEFSDFEVVVVDDASEDDTVAVLGRYEDPRLRVVALERNQGINSARQRGVEA